MSGVTDSGIFRRHVLFTLPDLLRIILKELFSFLTDNRTQDLRFSYMLLGFCLTERLNQGKPDRGLS